MQVECELENEMENIPLDLTATKEEAKAALEENQKLKQELEKLRRQINNKPPLQSSRLNPVATTSQSPPVTTINLLNRENHPESKYIQYINFMLLEKAT